MSHPEPRRLRTLAGLCLGLAAALGGCASGSPDYDARFGDAVRALRAQQLIEPGAPQRHADRTPPTDGRTVREGMAQQLESFRAPPPAPVITLGVGTGQ